MDLDPDGLVRLVERLSSVGATVLRVGDIEVHISPRPTTIERSDPTPPPERRPWSDGGPIPAHLDVIEMASRRASNRG